MDRPRKIYITGGAGSGKTTLAYRLAQQLALPVHELDTLNLSLLAEPSPITREQRFAETLKSTIERITAADAWLVEGSYLCSIEPLLQDADCIIWMDLPWRTAAYRIVSRHVRATLQGDNRFPGWRSLLRFLQRSRDYYLDRKAPCFNSHGSPETRATAIAFLAPYAHKLIAGNSEPHDILLARLTSPNR